MHHRDCMHQMHLPPRVGAVVRLNSAPALNAPTRTVRSYTLFLHLHPVPRGQRSKAAPCNSLIRAHECMSHSDRHMKQLRVGRRS